MGDIIINKNQVGFIAAQLVANLVQSLHLGNDLGLIKQMILWQHQPMLGKYESHGFTILQRCDIQPALEMQARHDIDDFLINRMEINPQAYIMAPQTVAHFKESFFEWLQMLLPG